MVKTHCLNYGLSMIKYLFLASLILLVHNNSLAQLRPDNPSIEHEPNIRPNTLEAPKEVAPPTGSTPSSARTPEPQLSLEQLRQHPQRFVQVINHTIRSRNWALLSQLIPLYQQVPQHDPLLVLYAQGILYRQNNQHAQAIEAYRALISADPELLYVRFDLAIMLYENKEYEAALDQFHKALAGNLKPELQAVAEQYIKKIQTQTAWQFYASLQPEHTSNVNNAASVASIAVGSNSLKLNGYEPPRSALGLRYYLNADKTHNLQGNHFLSAGLSTYGIQYQAKDKAFNETNLRAQFGYLYQDIKHQFSSKPFIEQVWFAGKKYQFNYGLNNNYRYWLKRDLQLNTDFQYTHKNYREELYKDYDANTYHLGLGLNYFYSPTLVFLGGVDFSREQAKLGPHSYKRYGARAAVIKEFKAGISTRIDFRYSYKKHDTKRWPDIQAGSAAAIFEQLIQADTPRRDHETRSTFTVWHRNIHFYGFTPKLSYTHHRINSSMPLFYSRRNNNVYLNLEQQF